MAQPKTENSLMTTATAAVVIDSSASVITALLGESITGKVNDQSLTQDKVIELVAARLNNLVLSHELRVG